MSFITVLVLIFFILAAADYLFGSRLAIGAEFEKGFKLLGTMALSMIGMIVISPLIADIMSPVFDAVYGLFGIDPSLIPAMLFANDMGGAPLSVEVAKNAEIGGFNALVVSSMMGATVSFTIPLSMQMVSKEHTGSLAIGLLCGIVTIPVGCFAAGLICGIGIGALCFDLLPLLVLSVIIALFLFFLPDICVRVFCAVGFLIRILVVTGLVMGAVNFLAKKELIAGLGSLEEGALICTNASIVMAGMFPLIYIISRLLTKPFDALGKRIGMNSKSMTGLIATLATNVTTFGMMNDMDKKGIVINSAFAVSAAFTFAGHLAFTMAFDADYLVPVIAGKLVAGVLSLAVAALMYKMLEKKSAVKKQNI